MARSLVPRSCRSKVLGLERPLHRLEDHLSSSLFALRGLGYLSGSLLFQLLTLAAVSLGSSVVYPPCSLRTVPVVPHPSFALSLSGVLYLALRNSATIASSALSLPMVADQVVGHR